MKPLLNLIWITSLLGSIGDGHCEDVAAAPPGSGSSLPRFAGSMPTEAGTNAFVRKVDSTTGEVTRWSVRTGEHPEDAQAWIHLGDALMQQSRSGADGQLFARAEAAYRRALILDGRLASALVGMAWVANTLHDFDSGRRCAREALAIDPRAAEAYALLGDAAVELGDYDEATEHYQACIDLRPDLSSYSRAAHLLWLTGDTRRATVLMQQAIAAGARHAENTAWCRAELGLILFHEGALAPAESQIKQALREAPDNAHVLSAMGRIQMARKDYPGAITSYERAVAIMPQHPALAALVDLYALARDPSSSERALARLREFHAAHALDAAATHSHLGLPAHAHPASQGNAELARFLADHDLDLDIALQEAERAYTTFKNVFVTDTLAWCYYKKGLTADAARLSRRALRWKTPDATILFHAGMIQAAAGDRGAARKYLYQALNLNPQFHPVDGETAVKRLAELGSPDASLRAAAVPVASPSPIARRNVPDSER